MGHKSVNLIPKWMAPKVMLKVAFQWVEGVRMFEVGNDIRVEIDLKSEWDGEYQAWLDRNDGSEFQLPFIFSGISHTYSPAELTDPDRNGK